MTAGDSDVMVVIECPLASISAMVGGGFSLTVVTAIEPLVSFGYWLGSLMTSSYEGGASRPAGGAEKNNVR